MTTPEEFAEKMRELCIDDDGDDRGIGSLAHERHTGACVYICTLLKELGYDEGAKVFEDTLVCYA